MELQKSVETLQALANGVNPTTGELIPIDAPYNNPEIIRALFACLEQLKAPPKRSKHTPEEKQADNISKGLPRNAGMPWTDSLKQELEGDFKAGMAPSSLAEKYQRTSGSIVHELKKQGLITEEEAKTMR